jgi:hypothetical protein
MNVQISTADIRGYVLEVLEHVEDEAIEAAAQILCNLFQLVLAEAEVRVFAWQAIATIQSKCKYYNHEIYQQAQSAQTIADPAPKPASNVTMNFNAPVYGAAGNVDGNQVIHPDSPTP